jgi:hypothetical protein
MLYQSIEPAESVFDLVTAVVERLVQRGIGIAVGFRWDAAFNPARSQRLTEPVCAIAFVAEQGLGTGSGVKRQCRRVVISQLTSLSSRTNRRPKLQQTAHNLLFNSPSIPSTGGHRSVLKWLAAVRWAFK